MKAFPGGKLKRELDLKKKKKGKEFPEFAKPTPLRNLSMQLPNR